MSLDMKLSESALSVSLWHLVFFVSVWPYLRFPWQKHQSAQVFLWLAFLVSSSWENKRTLACGVVWWRPVSVNASEETARGENWLGEIFQIVVRNTGEIHGCIYVVLILIRRHCGVHYLCGTRACENWNKTRSCKQVQSEKKKYSQKPTADQILVGAETRPPGIKIKFGVSHFLTHGLLSFGPKFQLATSI